MGLPSQPATNRQVLVIAPLLEPAVCGEIWVLYEHSFTVGESRCNKGKEGSLSSQLDSLVLQEL